MSFNSDKYTAREIIVGMTWLKLQLMQGSTMVCHHSRGKHYAQINNKTITEIHPNEASLVEEFADYHCFTFRDLKCKSSVGDMDYLKTEWKWVLFTAAQQARTAPTLDSIEKALA